MIQEKIEIIRDKFKNASIETLPELMTTYREDGRIGVGKILERAQKKLDAYNKELDRVQKMLLMKDSMENAVLSAALMKPDGGL